MPLTIGYLVHDLNDSAVARRVRSFEGGGATTRLAGFYRRESVSCVAGAPAFGVGRSEDAQLLRRAGLVARSLIRDGAIRRALGDAQVLVARNLEMLVIAARIRRPWQRLVYECLDIHRMMLRRDAVGRALRTLERRLLRGCDLVLTSSPAFIDRYFRTIQDHAGPMLLVENKILASHRSDDDDVPGAIASGPPWRIGWFGMLRCRKSFDLLRAMAEASDGSMEIVLAGRPAYSEIPDFDAVVAASAAMTYVGPYRAEQLGALYGQVHFAWAIDYFEEGLNSDWLLPNRLYESVAHGAVPIALASVESGRWLERQHVGVRVADPAREVPALLRALSPTDFRRLRDAVTALPDERTMMGLPACRALVATMRAAA